MSGHCAETNELSTTRRPAAHRAHGRASLLAALASTGAVTVTGDGSRLQVDDSIFVANAFVGDGFGTPSVPTLGSLSILDGGLVTTKSLQAGVRDMAEGTINVDGVG